MQLLYSPIDSSTIHRMMRPRTKAMMQREIKIAFQFFSPYNCVLKIGNTFGWISIQIEILFVDEIKVYPTNFPVDVKRRESGEFRACKQKIGGWVGDDGSRSKRSLILIVHLQTMLHLVTSNWHTRPNCSLAHWILGNRPIDNKQ
jgi:hypothetical protein